MKKILSIVVSLIILINIVPVTTYAESEKDLEAYLYDAVMNYQEEIDVSSYKIEYNETNKQKLRSITNNLRNKAFQLDWISYLYSSEYIITIYPYYRYTKDEVAEVQAAADEILDGIVGNSALTDVEKALLIHDRLIVWCEYDYQNLLDKTIPDDSFSPYGALAKGVAVCQGYAEAYTFLLTQVGIDSYVTTSRQLNHAWNIVTINGEKYHVDTTWDDPVWDVTGRVCHDNFLLSSDALYNNTHHEADDYDFSPDDTTYDDYYWQNSDAEFCLIGDEIYYIDGNIIKNTSSDADLYTIDSKWMASEHSHWSGNYSRLATDGETLFYSTADGVYKLDLSANTSTCIYQPDLSVGEWFSVYGFTYSDGYLICDRSNTPNFDGDTKMNYQVKHLYDNIPPVASVTSTNDVSSSQAVTISMSDNAGIAGYYWGTSSTYQNNPFTSTNDDSVTVQITDGGTYYLTVKDISNNISETKSITFYKTTLDANGASGAPSYIITASGNSFAFPSVSKSGYNFIGWSASATGTNVITSLTPTENTTYYAVFVGSSDTVTLSGSITSSSNNTEVTVRILSGATECAKLMTTESAYKFDIKPGSYVIEVSKANHVTRTYEITLTGTAVTQDVKIHLLGDVNGDGRVTNIDYVRAYSHAKGTVALGEYEAKCADTAKNDGVVTTIDAVRIYAHVKGTSFLWK